MGEPVETLAVIEPIALTKAGTAEVIAYACGKCGTVAGSALLHGDQARRWAEECCGPRRCACGALFRYRGYIACKPCHDREASERDAKAEAVAVASAKQRVPWAEYSGTFVYSDGLGPSDGYFPNLGELADYLASEELACPTHVWGCGSYGLHMDAAGTIESALEDHHEDAGDNIGSDDEKALQALLDAWCSTAGVLTYRPDYDTLIELDGFMKAHGLGPDGAALEEVSGG